MKLGQITISDIEESDQMKEALAALKAVNGELAQEKKRVKDLKHKLDKAVGIAGKVEKAVSKLSKLDV